MRGTLPFVLAGALFTVALSAHGTTQLVMLILALCWLSRAGYLAINELFGGTLHERALRKVTHRPLPQGEPLYASRRADTRTIARLEKELKPGTFAHGDCTILHRSEQAMLRCRKAS